MSLLPRKKLPTCCWWGDRLCNFKLQILGIKREISGSAGFESSAGEGRTRLLHNPAHDAW
jgi:hypothetical protein